MDIMIDIETWAKSDSAVIRAIGLVAFDPCAQDNDTVCLIDCRRSVDHQLEHGREIDPETVQWWRRQSLTLSNAVNLGKVEYQDSVITATTLQSITDAVTALIDHARESSQNDRITVWARSPSFDLRIISNLYRSIDLDPPWRFWEEADCRTLDKFLTRPYSARPHDPLSDCFAQAHHVRDAVKLLGAAAA